MNGPEEDAVENKRIADILAEIGDLLEIEGANAFRVRAYQAAARSVRDMSQRLADLVDAGEDLSELPAIGESTAEKIVEIVETETCERLEELRRRLPRALPEVVHVEGIGPKKAARLHEELGIDSVDDLAAAAEAGEVRELEGFGRRSEAKILEGIETLRRSTGRMLRNEADEHVESLRRHLESCRSVHRWEVAGSYRRGKETVGDLDVLVHAEDRERASEEILAADVIDDVASRGDERITVHLASGVQVDVRFFEPEAFGAALLYFTGSKDHNIALRRMAQERDWKLNEYGLFEADRRLAGADEEAIYRKLDLPWIAPELREDRGEIEAARRDELPSLLSLDDIRGDLHAHTDATDGLQSIDEMAAAARDRGWEYLAITDHSQRVRVAGGLDDEACLAHAARIREVDAAHPDIWVLAGIEVDILEHGDLDLAAETLAELDWVVASIHYHRELGEQAMTDRIVRAVESGLVHALGHPLGRMLGAREPLRFDTERVFAACAASGVCVEIDAQPERLDLPDTHCRQARQAGATFVIGTDAHRADNLDFMAYGVQVARRGWLGKDDVVNTGSAAALRRRLGRG
ncbi:DNA polymerase/3'-5' exonuclease PolX [bacterium]|nr:DNA polymerase/3'-5' exonuclease PolX [bacterium]